LRKIIVILIGTLLLLSCRTTQIKNSGITTSLLGVVYDKKSNPVQNAIITITNTQGVVIKSVNTDIDGKFLIPELTFGSYLVGVSGDNFLDTTVDLDHYDIENILIIRLQSFSDLIYLLEEELKEKENSMALKTIEKLNKIDKKDIYFNYLKAIYLIKTDNKEEAINILEELKSGNYKYVDLLLEDLKDDKEVN